MIAIQPVLEIYALDGFDLWPVAEIEPFDFLPLSGGLSPAELRTAVMRIAGLLREVADELATAQGDGRARVLEAGLQGEGQDE